MSASASFRINPGLLLPLLLIAAAPVAMAQEVYDGVGDITLQPPTSDDLHEYAGEDSPALQRLSKIDVAWKVSLAHLKATGSDLRPYGALLVPAAGLRGAGLLPAVGDYRCRSVQIGPGTETPIIAYPYFRCRVARERSGVLSLTKLDGSQRSRGFLFTDPAQRERRAIFLGTQALGDEVGFMEYGFDRDRAGVFERIGEARWRLVFPWASTEVGQQADPAVVDLEVVELVR